MAILDSTKLDALFKGFFSKARTSSSKQFFEENIPTSYDVHASEVYLEKIPSTPPSSDTAVVKKYSKLVLTKDKSVSNNLAWVALPEWSSDWSSGSANNIDTIHKNFIAPKYGSGYVVKVFKGDGTRIPELDASDWMFDYKAGVLTFQSNPGMDGTSQDKSVYIEVYQYIGRTAADGIGSAEAKTAKIEVVTKSIIIEEKEGDINLVDFEDVTYNVGENELMVFLNGVLMFPDEDYTETSTNSITFLANLEVGDKVVVRKSYIGY